MAKLANIDWYRDSDANETFIGNSTCNVTSEGVFYVSIPHPEKIGAIVKNLVEKSRDVGLRRMRRSDDEERLEGRSLDRIKDLVFEAIEEYLSVEVVEELVIQYGYTAMVKYAKNEQGQIHPNAGREGFAWHETKKNRSFRFANQTAWAVGFKAKVVKKITSKGNSQENTSVARPFDRDLGEWGQNLNKFIEVDLTRGDIEEVPYTEETARMFYEAMIGLCKVAERIEEALGDPQAIIEGGGLRLLGGGND